jgi:hypothetical protein
MGCFRHWRRFCGVLLDEWDQLGADTYLWVSRVNPSTNATPTKQLPKQPVWTPVTRMSHTCLHIHKTNIDLVVLRLVGYGSNRGLTLMEPSAEGR